MSELPNYVARELRPRGQAGPRDVATSQPPPSARRAEARRHQGLPLQERGQARHLEQARRDLHAQVQPQGLRYGSPSSLHAPHRMILDGEYVSRSLKRKGVFLFDVLQVDDRDIRPLPLSERKKVLREILRGNGPGGPLQHGEVRPRRSWRSRSATQGGIRGGRRQEPAVRLRAAQLVAQAEDVRHHRRASSWTTRRPRRWRGPASPAHGWSGSTTTTVGGCHIGKVGAFVEKVDPRQVKKDSVVEVRYQEITQDMKLRGAFILRVRHDKVPSECLLSQPSEERGCPP